MENYSFDDHCMAAAASLINEYSYLMNTENLTPETNQLLQSIMNIYTARQRDRFVQAIRDDREDHHMNSTIDRSTQTQLPSNVSQPSNNAPQPPSNNVPSTQSVATQTQPSTVAQTNSVATETEPPVQLSSDIGTQSSLEDSISDLITFGQIFASNEGIDQDIQADPIPGPTEIINEPLNDLAIQTDPISRRTYGTTTNSDWVTTRGTQTEPPEQTPRSTPETSPDTTPETTPDPSPESTPPLMNEDQMNYLLNQLSNPNHENIQGSSLLSSIYTPEYIRDQVLADEQDESTCYNNNSDIENFIESVTEPEVEQLECPVTETEVELNQSVCETPLYYSPLVSPSALNVGSALAQFGLEDVQPPQYSSTPMKGKANFIYI